MKVKKISENFSVSKQINLTDLPKLASLGYRSIICNRPDGEENGQPSFDEIRTAASAVDSEAHYLPVEPGNISDDEVAQFSKLLDDLPNPVLGYCRSSARSSTLWSRSQPKGSYSLSLNSALTTFFKRVKNMVRI